MSFLGTKRYAEAFFEVALEKGDPAAWHAHLQSVAELLGDAKVANFLEADAVAADAKVQVVQKSLKDMPKLVVNFVCLLAVRGGAGLLPQITDEFERLLMERNGQKVVRLEIAEELTEQATASVRKNLSSLLGSDKLVLQTQVNPALVGGIRIRVGDEVFDGSVMSGLEALRVRLVA